jgi:arsenite-transporting ATPase
LLPRLRDPDYTRLLIVTLPEATPVHEAAKLQEDLKRAEITPYAWVINQSLTPLAVTDPLLCSRQIREAAYIREVVDRHAVRTFVIPWQVDPPVGAAGLRAMIAGPAVTV